MKNTVKLGVISLLASFFLAGCVATSGVSGDVIAHKTVSTKAMHDIIKTAAQNDGWRMTEFRGNAMIAEKDGIVTTVTYQAGAITIKPENSRLKDTIEDALNH
ncbi:MAG: hypothetical protein DSZ03_08965 [Sulfurimonas sp.]|nr:MAG: hypothetical protein DSZ03_08965 [Sulfurimonas sp.]